MTWLRVLSSGFWVPKQKLGGLKARKLGSRETLKQESSKVKAHRSEHDQNLPGCRGMGITVRWKARKAESSG